METTHVHVPTSMPSTLDVVTVTRPRPRAESMGEVKASQNEGSGEDRWNYHERHNYKRKKSFGGSGAHDPVHPHNHAAAAAADGNYIPPNKKNRFYRRQPSVLPSKFLLGGNINDPLNLNSLGNSDNAVTPHTSPCPVPPHRVGEIPIFIPKNPDDPLGLRCDEDIETLQDMIAGVRTNQTKHRTRHRRKSTRKRNDSECSVETLGETEGEDLAMAISFVEESDHEEGRNRTSSFNQPKDEIVQESNKISSPHVLPPPPPPPNPEITSTTTEEKVEDKFNETDSIPIPISDSPIQYPFDFAEDDPISNVQGITIQVDAPADETVEASQIHFLPPFSPPPRPQNFLEPRIPPKPTSLPGVGRGGQGQGQLASQFDPHRKRARNHKLDPIVSPVIPQPGQKRNRHYNSEKQKNELNSSASKQPNIPNANASGSGGPSNSKFRSKDEIFQYGNYKRYYGYRNPNPTGDPRLSVFNKEWFSGKDVLDIGCNIGHITLSIARDFGPRRILGIDIDQHLIEIAKKNIVHYVGNRARKNSGRNSADADSKFPKSFLSIYGPLHPPLANETPARSALFPGNVKFQQENYVLDSDELLECVREEYDVILCLSLTKWIHLNFGDDGLKRFFRRGFYHLRPGGLYIVEPQPWSSYRRKMKLTERIANTSKTIKFFPDQFQDFLLNEVGFASVQNLGMSSHHIKGFQRPILVFTKGASPLPSSTTTTASTTTNRTDHPAIEASGSASAQKDCT